MTLCRQTIGRCYYWTRPVLTFCVLLTSLTLVRSASTQTQSTETAEAKLQRMSAALAKAQAELLLYQQKLDALQREVGELQQQIVATTPGQAPTVVPQGDPQSETNAQTTAAIERSLAELRERQDMVESQLATHEETKVETESKFPLKLSGLVLLNGFVNTRRVDIPPDPTYALPGSGSTGLSMRQTVLGFDARGPHIAGASSHADLRIDFFGSGGNQDGYSAGGIVRLRTAHASLKWTNTEVFAELDRSLIAPYKASSLVAIAQPEFAWSGDLWAWNPQVGLTHSLQLNDTSHLTIQLGLIDAGDPRLPNSTAATTSVTLAERSRWPGTEARVAIGAGAKKDGSQFGVGGYFSPHRTSDGTRFSAWATTADARLQFGDHIQLLGTAYRGMSIGGLGAGGYVDYFYQYRGDLEVLRPLDTVGGWTQLKITPQAKIELNGGFGIDNPFSKEIRYSQTPTGASEYTGIARNRQLFANIIYTPSSYLLLSLEYRRLWSSYAAGSTYSSDAIGLGAGYRF